MKLLKKLTLGSLAVIHCFSLQADSYSEIAKALDETISKESVDAKTLAKYLVRILNVKAQGEATTKSKDFTNAAAYVKNVEDKLKAMGGDAYSQLEKLNPQEITELKKIDHDNPGLITQDLYWRVLRLLEAIKGREEAKQREEQQAATIQKTAKTLNTARGAVSSETKEVLAFVEKAVWDEDDKAVSKPMPEIFKAILEFHKNNPGVITQSTYPHLYELVTKK